MGWAGSGALVAWHDVEEGREAEYLDWHSHEHMQERLAIPGFVEARRYSVVGSGPAFLILYAVVDPDVFEAEAYLERLNYPSDWTQRIMPALRNMNRSLCRVEASGGFGAGRWLQTLQFSPDLECKAGLRDVLTGEVRSLATQPGLCAAHLLIADRDRSRTPTREVALRGGQDTAADWVLLIEGYNQAAVAQDRAALLGRNGAGSDIAANLYAIDHVRLAQ